MTHYSNEIVRLISPFPYISKNGELGDGFILKQHETCINCKLKHCIDQIKKEDKNIFKKCPKGLYIYIAQLPQTRFVLNGLLLEDTESKNSRKNKKKYKSQSVSKPEIEYWQNRIISVLSKIDTLIENQIDLSLGMLHDVRTAVSLIFRNSEILVNEESGGNFDEKIENSPSAKKALFKSVSLLEERFKMMNLVSNPDAAKHGSKVPIPIFRLIDKITKVFQPLAETKKLNITLRGTSYRKCLLYESFSTIPLVLIDNAIKYSAPKQSIIVEVNDEQNRTSVKIESFSPKIYNDEKENIFHKNVRGRGADQIATVGSGLGLYLAAIVAEANGFKIQHSETGSVVTMNGQMFTNNTFYFNVK